MTALATVQRILAWRLFSRREEASSTFDIIKWWELRRVPYNIAVGMAGIVTLGVVVAAAMIAEGRFDVALGSPIVAGFTVIGYAIGANVCFTGGWMAEIAVRKLWRERAGPFAEISFAFGFIFFILLTLVPAALFTGLLIVRLLLR